MPFGVRGLESCSLPGPALAIQRVPGARRAPGLCKVLCLRGAPRADTAAYNEPMISREPTLERLPIARQLLLDPFGLDEVRLERALGAIGEHRVDDADLYFQISA